MKVKDLKKILETMDEETELSLYCGGENYHNDYPLNEVEHYKNNGFICFILTDEGKYGIAREVDLEDFENAIDCIEGNLSKSNIDKSDLFNEFQNRLANIDMYNEIYNETLQETIKDLAPEIMEDK